MKTLSVAGTSAMFLVGGGILTHGITPLNHGIKALAAKVGGFMASVVPVLRDAVIDVSAGALVMVAVTLVKKVWPGERIAPQ